MWKSADKAELAAEAMGITSDRLKELNLIDEIVPEPLGGAHRDRAKMAYNLKTALKRHLQELQEQSLEVLLQRRYERLMDYGVYLEGDNS